ncbi:MAG: serine/threonine-protein kinase HipA [Candidatus Eremiobacteraeota bacterium]|nr:serine/threonine-protein kinase HipA [Candidatus Eremiobacteraeota bacterium]
MKLPRNTALHVALALSAERVVPVGRLALDRRGAVLEYDPSFVAGGLAVNPLAPPALGPIPAREPRTFDGMHGIFADSLPDAWGTELVRRRCEREGIRFESLNALDRLAIVGKRGMGALTYRPDIPDDGSDTIDFDALAHEANEILEGRDSDLLPELERLGGASGGALPKVLVALNADGHARSGAGDIPDGYDAWLVKFPSSHDVKDIGPLEAAYAGMARAARIDVPDHRLIPAGANAPAYFASKRFDRAAGRVRRHVVSVAGVLDIDWTVPQIDYDVLLRLVLRVTRSQHEVEEMFRRMVFNIVAHNRDDHAKQHAFISDDAGHWRLAPAYDLTYSTGPNREHYLAVNGQAADVDADAVRAVADNHRIKPRRLRAIVGDVLDAAARFDDIAGEAGVSKRTAANARRAIAPSIARIAPLAK